MDNPSYFLHIPKTGGSSFTLFLDNNFHQDEICPAQLLPELFQSSINSVRHYTLYRGHFWYGLESYLNISLQYMTILRDPIQRTISWYYHVCRDKNAYRHSRVIDEKWSLLDFVRDQETNWDTTNTQTLFLAVDLDYSRLALDAVGYGQMIVKQHAARLNDRELLEKAKNRLDKFYFVGITERMQESMLLLAHQMGWNPDMQIPKLNVSRSRLLEAELSCDIEREILAINQLDSELYKWALSSFEERVGEMIKDLMMAKHRTSHARTSVPCRMELVPIEERRLFGVRVIEAPSEIENTETFYIVVEIANNSSVMISSAAPNPVHISYHFIDRAHGVMAVFDGDRTTLSPELAPGGRRAFAVLVKAPEGGGLYTLRVTIVQEGVAWFDEIGSDVFCDSEILVK